MRRAATVLSLCIALISGIVLSLAWGQPPLRSSLIQAVPSSEVEETALAFYEAVNSYLDGGNDIPLRRLLHPDFVNHDPGSPAGGNAATFLRQLDSIRELYDGIQLEPEVVYLGNADASVSLSLSDRQRHEFAGIGIDPGEMVGRLDLLRIERRLIVERWSSAALAGELDPYPSLSLELPFSLNRLVTRVQQISVDGAAQSTIDPFGHLLIIVQSGEMSLEVLESATIPVAQWRVDDGRIADPALIEEPGMTVTLDRLEAVLLPAGTRFRVWNTGAAARDATLLALEFGPPVSGDTSPRSPNIVGELEETLWSGISLSGVGKRLTLSFGRATLIPQATMSNQEVKGMELTWVSGGSIEMAASGGMARVRGANGVRSQLNEGNALLHTGDTGAAGPGSGVYYQATGNTPATVWFFSIVPAEVETNENDAGGPTPFPIPPRTAS